MFTPKQSNDFVHGFCVMRGRALIPSMAVWRSMSMKKQPTRAFFFFTKYMQMMMR
jgi:hypothetical protein